MKNITSLKSQTISNDILENTVGGAASKKSLGLKWGDPTGGNIKMADPNLDIRVPNQEKSGFILDVVG